MTRFLSVLGPAAVPALLLAAGCGGRAPVDDQLAAHFRSGLTQLAEMDANEDSGVEPRVGKLDAVKCAARRCTVRWTTWDGRRMTTRYAMSGDPSCFTARAEPPLPDILDDTIGAYDAHPLNDLGTKPGLSC